MRRVGIGSGQGHRGENGSRRPFMAHVAPTALYSDVGRLGWRVDWLGYRVKRKVTAISKRATYGLSTGVDRAVSSRGGVR